MCVNILLCAPIGHILARFSSDTNIVDVVLPHQVSVWLPTLLRVSNLVQFLCVMIVKIAVMPPPPSFYDVHGLIQNFPD